MTTDHVWKKSARCWTGFEELPGNSGTCILRTHPFSRLLTEAIVLLLSWVCWLLIFDNSLNHSHKPDTFFGGVFSFLTSPVIVWGYGALLVVASIMAVPQTLIFEAGAPMFTYLIGFECFGIRIVRSHAAVRGLLLIGGSRKGQPYTNTYVEWDGIGLPAMIGECNDYEVARDRADYISTRTGVPRLSVDCQKEAELLRDLRVAGCFSVLLGIDLLWIWHSKGSVPFSAYLHQDKLHPTAADFFLPMSLVFFPLMVVVFILTAFKLGKMRKQPRRLEDRRA